jgi:superfamily II DNA or RNA helicase
MYGIERYGPADSNQIPEGLDIDLHFHLQLKPEQQIPADETMRAYREKGGGILSLPCGFGKTILALYFIGQLKKKTLVVVHKEFLMNQWIERIRFALPEAKVGIIQADKCQIDNCDIILGMLQTLSMKEFELNTFDDIGHVIIDECHCIPSRVFSRALLKINSKYMLGLSATPNRKDGLTRVLKYYIGDLIYSVKSSDRNVVKVERYCFESEWEEYNREVTSFRGQVLMPTMINNICAYYRRTQCFMRRIHELIMENEERQILILSDRKQHLEDMYRIGEELGIPSIGYYIGGMKEKKLKESERCRLLLGTYPMASTGLDIPTLNCMVLASPRSDIIQSIGRIDRKKHENIQPIIIDCVDQFSLFESQARKRFDIYRKKNYEVTDIHIQIDTPEFRVLHQKTYQFKKKKDKNASALTTTPRTNSSTTTVCDYFNEQSSSESEEEVQSRTVRTTRTTRNVSKTKTTPTKKTEKELVQEMLKNPNLYMFSDDS